MHNRNSVILISLASVVFLLTISTLACTIPFTSNPTPAIPNEVITAAVKTMQAKFTIATLTAIPSVSLPSPTITASKSPEPTSTATSIPTKTNQPTATTTATSSHQPSSKNPTPVLNVSSKPGYKLMAVNIHKCGKFQTAFFTISNISDNTFQSAIIQVEDLTTGKVLYGPVTTNTPFRAYDDDCSNRISALKGHHTAFVAAQLSKKKLVGHSLWGSFTFCTKDNLGGLCYQDTFEFVYP